MSTASGHLEPGGPRSAGAIPQRRIPQAWPKDRRFRILSLDGGGIKGLYAATFMAELERRYLGGKSIASYFDLVAGTSTGGIIALGLGASLTSSALAELYVDRGAEIFPQPHGSPIGKVRGWWRTVRHFTHYRYERSALEKMLDDTLGDRLFGESVVRLCIPAFEGKHSEVFVFKTPHHADYKHDRFERMVKVALATSAAPTYFRPLEHGGHKLVDGGVWANNPVMLAIVEALICFDLDRSQIDVLSIGCGDEPYVVSDAQIEDGGKLAWANVIFAAMRLQSLSAINQARLLLGPPSVHRIDPPSIAPPILLDDFGRSLTELVPAAKAAAERNGSELAEIFFGSEASTYVPVPLPTP